MFDDFKEDLDRLKKSKEQYDLGFFYYISALTYVILKNVVPIFIVLILVLLTLSAFVFLFIEAPVIGVAITVIATLIIIAAMGENVYYDPDQFEKRKDEEI